MQWEDYHLQWVRKDYEEISVIRWVKILHEFSMFLWVFQASCGQDLEA